MRRSLYQCFVRLPLLVVAGLLIMMGIFAKRGWLDWRRMVGQNQEIEAKIAVAASHKAEMERQLTALRTDPAEQERLVRQLLGYVKPAEIVIEFP